MAYNLGTLIEKLEDDREFITTLRHPLAQFGSSNRQLLGATLLPDRNRELYENSFDDEDFEIRAIAGRDTTRYSPVDNQTKIKHRRVHIELGEMDSGSSLHASHIDALNRTLARQGQEAGTDMLVSMVDDLANGGLNDKKEIQRWEALVFAKIRIQLRDKQAQDIQLLDPTGHRFDAGGLWSDNAYNPFLDLFEMYRRAEEAGHPLRAAYCRGRIWALLQRNATVASKLGVLQVNNASQLQSRESINSRSQIQLYLQSEGYPPLTVYNLDYHTPTGTGYFLRDDVIVGVGSTPKQYELTNLPEGSEDRILYNRLGFFEIGTCAGQDSVGPVVDVSYHKKKPVGIEVEAYLTGVTNVQEDEAVFVIKNIN